AICQRRCRRHQARGRETLVQVGQDGDVLGQHGAVDLERGHFALRVQLLELGRLVLALEEADHARLERDTRFLERDSRDSAPGFGSGVKSGRHAIASGGTLRGGAAWTLGKRRNSTIATARPPTVTSSGTV